MQNPLLDNLGFNEQWVSLNALIDLTLLIGAFAFVMHSIFYKPERCKRIAFILAVLTMLFYQLPFVIYSPLFYHHLPNVTLFALSIHAAVAINLLWVYCSPGLNIQQSQSTRLSSRIYFQGFPFWFPLFLFGLLLSLYFYKIPFTCTALYSLFVDQEITLLVREIIGKLMGRTYAPHLLNILTSAIGPIMCFVALGKVYYSYLEKEWLNIACLLLLLVLIISTPLLGGAKGSLVPMAVALSVSGFLVIKNWKWRLISSLMIFSLFSFLILLVKVVQESKVGMGTYPFASCVVKLGVCDRTEVLLESLKLSKSYYGLSKVRIADLNSAMTAACYPDRKMNKNTIISSDTNHSEIVAEKGIKTHICGLIYRILVTPLQVASWHFIYVSDFGKPGLSAMPIAKYFTRHYVNVPASVCETYYSGDKTSSCTAPTSYLFTYPAYFGASGLLLAIIVTILFDVLVASLIRYAPKPYSDLTVGVMSIAAVNFIVADFTTVLLSHGAAIALAILYVMSLFCYLKNDPPANEQLTHVKS